MTMEQKMGCGWGLESHTRTGRGKNVAICTHPKNREQSCRIGLWCPLGFLKMKKRASRAMPKVRGEK